MDVDAGVSEIWQTTAVIKVHVGEHNVSHIFWLVAEMRDLAHGSLLRVHGHNRHNLKYANDARSMNVIVLPETSVHQYQPLAGFDQ